MDKYYYFVAQLPTLFFDREAPITIEEFLDEGEKWMGSRDFALLSRVDVSHTEANSGDPQVLQNYKAFEFDLRNELALWRGTRGTDQEYRPSGFSLSALREGTPLDVERRLLQWRWDFIDEEEREHHFDLEVLVLYLLKLQILRRLLMFDKEEGLETFQNLCEAEV